MLILLGRIMLLIGGLSLLILLLIGTSLFVLLLLLPKLLPRPPLLCTCRKASKRFVQAIHGQLIASVPILRLGNFILTKSLLLLSSLEINDMSWPPFSSAHKLADRAHEPTLCLARKGFKAMMAVPGNVY